MEYLRGINHGGGGAWLTGSRVPQDGQTPLHWAAENGREAMMELLCKAGADKEAKDEVSGGRVQGESGAVRCGSLWFRFYSFGTEWNDLSKM